MRRIILEICFIVLGALSIAHAADMSVQLTTNDGSSKYSFLNSNAVEVSSVTSLGDGYFRNLTARSLQINNTVIVSTAGHFIGTGSAPTVNVGAGLLALLGVSAGGTGTDSAGEVTLTIGAAIGSGALVNVVFSSPYGTAPYVVITPSSSAGISLNTYVTSTSTGFTINSLANVSALTIYKWHYHVIQ